jgi:aryl-alcohol dehydrogenase-like predicted oxidoreductase
MNSPIDLTRRSAIKLGALAGAGLALSRLPLYADDAGLPLITKAIPSSGKKIPVIGLGTNAYGVDAAEELAARREVLKRMPEVGLSVVDTAPGYGKSESVIGTLVSEIGNRDKLFLATKVTVDGDNLSGGIAMLEESFKRLKTDRIDLIQVHSLRGTALLLPVLRDWKKAGRIGYYGVTTSNDRQYEDLIKVLENEKLDFVQVDYSVGNRNADERILPLAADKGVAALINLPLGGRRGNNLITQTTGKPLPDFAKEINATSWAQIMLKYVVSHPGVTTAIPGTTKVKHLEDNAGAARGVLPDAAMRKRIEQAFAAL